MVEILKAVRRPDRRWSRRSAAASTRSARRRTSRGAGRISIRNPKGRETVQDVFSEGRVDVHVRQLREVLPRGRQDLQPHHGSANRLSRARHAVGFCYRAAYDRQRSLGQTVFIDGRQWAAGHKLIKGFRVYLCEDRSELHARGFNEQPFSGCLPPPADGCSSRLVYAAGRPVHETVPGYPGQARILEICKRPDLAAAVTLQPVEILDVDAAIIFADLLLPVEPMGLKLQFVARRRPADRQPGSHLVRCRLAVHLEHRRTRLCWRIDPAGREGAGRTRPCDWLCWRAVHDWPAT